MKIFKTVISLLKVKKLSLIEKHNVSGNIFTFIFDSKTDLNWVPGQHGIFRITHKKIKKATRLFSIASLPEENKIIISTRIHEEPSAFKKAMSELKPGMTIDMRGPIGSLYKKNDRMKIMIATGIGITPYRGIVKEVTKSENSKFRLLYLSKESDFIYKDILSCENNDLVECYNQRKDMLNSLDNLIENYKNNADYYIVGSPKVVKSIEQLIKEKGISRKNIRKDTFFGY